MVSNSVNPKRVAPKEVEPVEYDGVIYTAPHFVGEESQNGGFVEARNKNEKLLWRIKVYKTKYSSNIENDVQDIFILKLRINRSELIVIDEKKRSFRVDLKTKDISKID